MSYGLVWDFLHLSDPKTLQGSLHANGIVILIVTSKDHGTAYHHFIALELHEGRTKTYTKDELYAAGGKRSIRHGQ